MAMLNNENRYIPNNELNQLLHRIENDATEIYHTRYGSDDTRIKFNVSNRESDTILLGRQSAKSLECISWVAIQTAMQFVYSLWQSLLQDFSLTFRSPNNLTGIVRF